MGWDGTTVVMIVVGLVVGSGMPGCWDAGYAGHAEYLAETVSICRSKVINKVSHEY